MVTRWLNPALLLSVVAGSLVVASLPFAMEQVALCISENEQINSPGSGGGAQMISWMFFPGNVMLIFLTAAFPAFVVACVAAVASAVLRRRRLNLRLGRFATIFATFAIAAGLAGLIVYVLRPQYLLCTTVPCEKYMPIDTALWFAVGFAVFEVLLAAVGANLAQGNMAPSTENGDAT